MYVEFVYFVLCYRMEFGLQKSEKIGSPVLVGNPRKRIEAKAYRARDRKDGGWFQHDVSSPEKSPNVSPAASPLPLAGGHSKQAHGNLHVRCSNDKQQLLKLKQFNVAAGVTTEPLSRGQNLNKMSPSTATARLHQQIYPSCSVWYRHEHTVVTGDLEEEEKSAKNQGHSPIPSWRCKNERGDGQFSPRSRRVCAEAEEYWKRNHDGSAKDWFKHEHTLVAEKENEFADFDEIGTSLRDFE